jgi:hypothetical protein
MIATTCIRLVKTFWRLIEGQTRRLYDIPASVVKLYTPATPFYG